METRRSLEPEFLVRVQAPEQSFVFCRYCKEQISKKREYGGQLWRTEDSDSDTPGDTSSCPARDELSSPLEWWHAPEDPFVATVRRALRDE